MSISDDERACVRFDPDGRFMWADQTGLPTLDDKNLDAAYDKARSFILKQIDDLVVQYGWKEDDSTEDNLLVCLFPPDGRVFPTWNLIWSFKLPTKFSEFVNCRNPGTWGKVFAHIEAKRLNGNNEDVAIWEPEPLVNILYFLQCIAPGLLTVVGITGGDDDEEECARGLPPPNWLSRNAKVLTEVLGETYDRLLKVSKDPRKPFKYATIPFRPSQLEEETEEDSFSRYENASDDNNGRRTPDVSDCDSAEEFAVYNNDCDWHVHSYY